MGKLTSFLALDVLFSLAANLSFFSHYLHQKIQPTLTLFYLSSVWALYLADHLWDASREEEPFSERARFYLRFRLLIVSLFVLLAFLSLYIGFFLESVFLWNKLPLILSFLFFLVLIVIKRSPIPKEILVSLFYTLGVFAPFSLFFELNTIVWIFYLHVQANVLLTYDNDREFDRTNQTYTLTQYWNPQTIRMVSRCLLGFGMILLLSFWILEPHSGRVLLGLGLTYLWLGVCSFRKGGDFPFKSLCELSYLPMFLPQIFFFFSLLP
ncbi:hypothetical protein EHQ49_18145 [Leptospira perdikensis]|uniref:Prenyltransferase n=1 Tax=Leptospira perdikensis TaxID=2484948 RepID=A0A4R9J696_9LEPT|nr:hypothetical protein EHQ49_18145 [Leptospira perdikensis]